MGIDDGFADREPDPGSGTLPATRRVAAVEAFENMGQLIGRNAVAIIGHGDHGPLRLRAPRDGDVSAGGRVAKRVGQKVAQHLSDPVGVDVDAQAVGLAEVQGEVDALVLIAAARGFRASEQEIADETRRPPEAEPAFLGPRDVVDVVGEPGQPGCLGGENRLCVDAEVGDPVEQPLVCLLYTSRCV